MTHQKFPKHKVRKMVKLSTKKWSIAERQPPKSNSGGFKNYLTTHMVIKKYRFQKKMGYHRSCIDIGIDCKNITRIWLRGGRASNLRSMIIRLKSVRNWIVTIWNVSFKDMYTNLRIKSNRRSLAWPQTMTSISLLRCSIWLIVMNSIQKWGLCISSFCKSVLVLMMVKVIMLFMIGKL